ncbi:MAG TPA: cytochrome c3 family protein [Thermoanaerobaculia bacterium]|nr:cytochrome c3 family protein [Thermoanaerobaculia bacterium]
MLIAIGAAALAAVAALGAWYWFSPEYTDVGYRPHQPVAYSHRLHAGELQIDCRYCHYTVETTPAAGVPSTSVCMNCHQLVGRDLASLAMVRDSLSGDRPLRWVRVHDLPEYARFDHSLHVAAGVGCSSCHGDVAAMDEVMQVEPLSMGWCLECHRDPAPFLRDPAQITDTSWEPPEDQLAFAHQLLEGRSIAPPTDCTGCHQ